MSCITLDSTELDFFILSGLTHPLASVGCEKLHRCRSTSRQQQQVCMWCAKGVCLYQLQFEDDQLSGLQSALKAKIRDPDADETLEQGGRDPPNIFWRVAAALMYIVPWIDVIALGREVYHHFPSSIVLFMFPGTVHNLLFADCVLAALLFPHHSFIVCLVC